MGSSLRLWGSSGKRPPDRYEKDCFPTSPVAHVHTHTHTHGSVFLSSPLTQTCSKYRCLSLVVNYTHQDVPDTPTVSLISEKVDQNLPELGLCFGAALQSQLCQHKDEM